MRNITVLPILVTILFLFSVNNSIYSQEQHEIFTESIVDSATDNVVENAPESITSSIEDGISESITDNTLKNRYGFSISPYLGFVYGQSFELVYPTDTAGEFLSELTWDMKPVFYVGLQADFSRSDLLRDPSFFASLGFKIGIPGDSGIMENRDWMDVEIDHLTHFSSHTNKTRKFYWADAAIGVSVPIKNVLYVKTFLSASWMHFAFTGRDGYGEYAREKTFHTYHPINDNPTEESYKGQDVISYHQYWFLLAPGISIGTSIFFPFSFELSCTISSTVYCNARDDHFSVQFSSGLWSTPRTFLDFTSGGFYIEPKGNISLSTRPLDFLLEFSWRYIGRTRGESYMRWGNSQTFNLSGEAGASLSLLNTRFLVRARIF